MAFLVCINFSLPLPASETLIQMKKSDRILSLTICLLCKRSGLRMDNVFPSPWFDCWEKNRRKSAVGRFSNQATRRTGMNYLTPIATDRRISSVEAWSCLPHKMANAIRFLEPVPFHLNVSAGTETVLCGYWVGPDVEDGWGFVNAFVNQIL